MNRQSCFLRISGLAALGLLCLSMGATVVLADDDESFAINWYTIDCGGGEGGGLDGSGGDWSIEGTIAQVDAGAMNGPPTFGSNGQDETFSLQGGFWPATTLPPACLADITGDRVVDVDDLLTLINDWGSTTSTHTDINGNGIVDVDDLLMVINGWGSCDHL